MLKLLLLFVSVAFITSCSFLDKNKNILILQPFSGISQQHVQHVYEKFKPVYDTVIINPAIPLPEQAYYSPRNRYRAKSLLDFLKTRVGRDTTIIGLTGKDISTTKNNVKDFGIFGVAYRPSNVCMASTFRLNKRNVQEQFYKVSIHELAHTTGLPHCEEKSCYLRDAKGGNPLDEETSFCNKCLNHLRKKGWKI